MATVAQALAGTFKNGVQTNSAYLKARRIVNESLEEDFRVEFVSGNDFELKFLIIAGDTTAVVTHRADLFEQSKTDFAPDHTMFPVADVHHWLTSEYLE